jgi:hypothetical protein
MNKDVAINLRIILKKLPEHAAFDVELTLFSVEVNLLLVHNTFVALRD